MHTSQSHKTTAKSHTKLVLRGFFRNSEHLRFTHKQLPLRISSQSKVTNYVRKQTVNEKVLGRCMKGKNSLFKKLHITEKYVRNLKIIVLGDFKRRIWLIWRRKWQPTPVFLPGESHGHRSLVGYSP